MSVAIELAHYAIIIVLLLSTSCWRSIAESSSTLNCKWCLLMVKMITHTMTTTMPMPLIYSSYFVVELL
jgi:hypothetical protein